MIKKYRKKPVVIEAIQYNDYGEHHNLEDIKEFIKQQIKRAENVKSSQFSGEIWTDKEILNYIVTQTIRDTAELIKSIGKDECDCSECIADMKDDKCNELIEGSK